MFLTMLGDLAVFWLYVTLICSFLHCITSVFGINTSSASSGSSAQLIGICYLCHAATAVSDKEIFSYCTHKIWNDIPLSVRQSPSPDSFKRNLKTHYFVNNLPPGDCLQRLWFDILDILDSIQIVMNEWMNEKVWQHPDRQTHQSTVQCAVSSAG